MMAIEIPNEQMKNILTKINMLNQLIKASKNYRVESVKSSFLYPIISEIKDVPIKKRKLCPIFIIQKNLEGKVTISLNKFEEQLKKNTEDKLSMKGLTSGLTSERIEILGKELAKKNSSIPLFKSIVNLVADQYIPTIFMKSLPEDSIDLFPENYYSKFEMPSLISHMASYAFLSGTLSSFIDALKFIYQLPEQSIQKVIDEIIEAHDPTNNLKDLEKPIFLKEKSIDENILEETKVKIDENIFEENKIGGNILHSKAKDYKIKILSFLIETAYENEMSLEKSIQLPEEIKNQGGIQKIELPSIKVSNHSDLFLFFRNVQTQLNEIHYPVVFSLFEPKTFKHIFLGYNPHQKNLDEHENKDEWRVIDGKHLNLLLKPMDDLKELIKNISTAFKLNLKTPELFSKGEKIKFEIICTGENYLDLKDRVEKFLQTDLTFKKIK